MGGRALVIVCGMLFLAGSVIAHQATGKGDPEAAKIKNPVASTPESIAAGQKQFQALCAGCHGKDAKGGMTISVIEDRAGISRRISPMTRGITARAMARSSRS